MHIKPATLLIAAALPVALAFAQEPPSGPPDAQTMVQMRVNMLASVLSLTDAQKTTATNIFTTAATSAETIRTNMQTARQSLSEAIKKNDTATIDQASATVGTLTGQLTAVESRADAAFYATLTADQKTKYDAMPHGGPGFGGPGGPGAPGGMFRPRQ